MIFGFDPARSLILRVFLRDFNSNITVACIKTIRYVGFNLARRTGTATELQSQGQMGMAQTDESKSPSRSDFYEQA